MQLPAGSLGCMSLGYPLGPIVSHGATSAVRLFRYRKRARVRMTSPEGHSLCEFFFSF